MANVENVLTIFLASPGDVNQERSRVNEFVEEWNDVWSSQLKVHLKLIKWETHAYPSAGVDGQDVINSQIGDGYDLFLGVMWKRFGTPTGRASSGTVEEYDRALSRRRQTGSPEMMFYFKNAKSTDEQENDQIRNIQNFKNQVIKDGLLYWSFTNEIEFGKLTRIHITRHIQKWAKSNIKPQPPSGNSESEFRSKFYRYFQSVESESSNLAKIILEFASKLNSYNTANTSRALLVRNMSDDELTEEFIMKAMVDNAQCMMSFANDIELFEKSFDTSISVFIENTLHAAAISIALSEIPAKKLQNSIKKIKSKLRPTYLTVENFAASTTALSPKLQGVMLNANTRIVEGLRKFSDHLKLGERMLNEAEKLFNQNK